MKEIWKIEARMEDVKFKYCVTVNLYKNIFWEGAVTTLNCRLNKWYLERSHRNVFAIIQLFI
jgi:hypothetical protein